MIEPVKLFVKFPLNNKNRNAIEKALVEVSRYLRIIRQRLLESYRLKEITKELKSKAISRGFELYDEEKYKRRKKRKTTDRRRRS